MSEAARAVASARRRWALPGSRHDLIVRTTRFVLPIGIGALVAFLSIAPLTIVSDMSFVLDKNKVEVAKERMRATEALYRGEDNERRPFSLRAGSAVQQTSSDPVVRLSELSARIVMAEGPAVLQAGTARYNMDTQNVTVDGPVTFQTADGYRLATRDVDVDLKTRDVASRGAVEGRMPIGTFSGDRMTADLNARIVRVEGRARLRIVQGAVR